MEVGRYDVDPFIPRSPVRHDCKFSAIERTINRPLEAKLLSLVIRNNICINIYLVCDRLEIPAFYLGLGLFRCRAKISRNVWGLNLLGFQLLLITTYIYVAFFISLRAVITSTGSVLPVAF